MEQGKKKPLPKVVLRPTPPALKIVVTVLIVFSMAALLAMGWVLKMKRDDLQAKKDEAAALEQENQDLSDKIDNIGSVDSVKDIAREELGLVDPNTIVIQPES